MATMAAVQILFCPVGVEEIRNMDCVLEVTCPAKCMCAESIVDCRGRGLTFIPSNIPEDTTEV